MSSEPPVPPPRGHPTPLSLEAQDSVTPSEDWGSEDETDYLNYYGEEDVDVLPVSGNEGPPDASFQCDPEHYSFLCLSIEETWNFLDSQARDASRAIKLDVGTSRILLQYLNWNLKKLVESYSEDSEELMKNAKLKPAGSSALSVVTLVGECPVCLRPVGGACSIRRFPCGHMFCLVCCVDHILARLAVGVSTAIECLQCHRPLDLETVQSMLKQHAEASARFLRFSLSDYVVSHPLLRWCPGPNCTIVFQVSDHQAKKVSCSKCSTSCCFSCGEAYHCPTDCDCIREWLAKCRDDSETANYIMANTKDCPNCHTSIEKNGGCNHMSCSQCHSDFCWMCLGPWKNHNGYYNCSKYKEDAQEVSAARQALEKYIFYYHRWANHNRSLSLEEVTRKKIVDRMEEKVAKGEGTWIDWQYLLDAVSLLRKCRYTLKYTYPYAYFLTGDKKPLFEFQQAQLEVEIENLSWKVERAETTDVAELRQQMNTAEVKRLTLLRDFVTA